MEQIETKTRGQLIAEDVAALIRARNPLLWVVTKEEARVEQLLVMAAASAGYATWTWDIAQGTTRVGEKLNPGRATSNNDPGEVMNTIRVSAAATGSGMERRLWILRDLPVWLGGPPGAQPMRQLRNLARSLPGTPTGAAQAIVVLTPTAEVPPELAGHATVIEWPLPDKAEVASILDAAINSMPEFEKGEDGAPDPTKPLRANLAPNGVRDAAIDAAIGLSGEEAAACFARSLVQLRRIDPPTIAKEKKRVITRERVLEWYDPLPGGLDAVGGLENLKAWLLSRGQAYSPKARAFGLPAPKGSLLVGVPGCGKTLTAKVIATAWGVPLLRMDLGALKSKFVGDSEANLRKAFRVIEAIGRCVVWLDEIEKALQGATSGSADGGVSSDALGAILSWMQERQGEAFVIATANDVSALPPELLRKGRFDEVWFVDLPTMTEREQVLAAALRTFKRSLGGPGIRAVAEACEGFTGSEIAAIVPDALFAAFSENATDLTVGHLLAAAKTVTPLKETMAEKIAELRKWAEGRARKASRPDVGVTATRAGDGGRVLDVA